MARITVDPITRIEGHLRVDAEVNNGRVSKAWSSAQMFRGIETILQGRDPRDAWLYTQRFCGVCTTVHAICSVRTVEDALNIAVPKNAQYIRNIIIGAHATQDNIVHFYHLSALDFVDIVSALQADPAEAAKIAQSISDWPGNTTAAFAAAKDRLAKFVQTGKLGIFGSGYWGHPAMKLPPAVNLIAFAHYLQALDYQRKAAQTVALLGGKDPHIQNLCVGGVATAINMDNVSTFNMERAAWVRQNLNEVKQFINQVYIPDVLAVASFYPDWFKIGKGVTNYLAVPEYPLDETNSSFMDKGGLLIGDAFREVKDWKDAEIREKTVESTAAAWYNQPSPLHPFVGEAIPEPGEFDAEGRYSWCKAPRLGDKPVQVGPLAQILTAYHAGCPKTKALVDYALGAAKITVNDLHSTLGRHAARAIRSSIAADRALENLDLLLANIASGDVSYANPVGEFPAGEQRGVGFHEAVRGVLSHWIVIDNGKIGRYQAVVPTTWNASPRDEAGVAGPYEASLEGTPIADETKPLEIIRTIHSYDPCIACAVHTFDPEGKEVTNITVD